MQFVVAAVLGEKGFVQSAHDGSDLLVVDYTAVSKRTNPVRFIPYGANDIVHNLGASSVFSTIDLASGY
jgi:hypothetical protein